jgi:putative intracellular protease/amidase
MGKLNGKRVAFLAAKGVEQVELTAPWTLVEAGVVRGRRLTSYPSLRTDIREGAHDRQAEQTTTA